MKLPEAFIASLPIVGEELSAFIESLATDSPTSVRFNPQKAKPNQGFQQVPWCEDGYVLPARPRFTSDPAFHAGAYYPQEASSMFLESLVKSLELHTSPILALDLCAAPGGKANLLRSILHPTSFLHANETIASRAKILDETMLKWGISGYAVSQKDPALLGRLEHMFDLIVVDAPCSGEGMFRKNPAAINEWSPNLVHLCSARQKRILADIWPALKPGGRLIYSTCTYNREENEDNLAWLKREFEAEGVSLKLPAIDGLIETEVEGISGYRFMPHRTTGEGFFIAAVQKPHSKSIKRKKTGRGQFTPYRSSLLDDKSFYASDPSGNVFALMEEHLQKLIEIQSAGIKLYQPGLPVGKDRAGQFKPDHGYAMQATTKKHLPIGNLSLEDALIFLSRGDLPSGPSANGDLLLMQFEGFNLGLGKSRNGRITSEYPIHWRILQADSSRYTPIALALEGKKI